MNWFLAVQILASIVKLSAMSMNWERTVRYTLIAEAMSHDRFLMVWQFFHINDDSLPVPSYQTGHDKLHKIRPMYDELRGNLKSILPEERQSLDEQMIQGSAKFQKVIERQASFMGYKCGCDKGRELDCL